MQQGEGGRGGSQSRPRYGGLSPPQVETPQTAALTTHILLGAATDHHHRLQQQEVQVVEEASPISSRPPATATSTTAAANLDEFMRVSADAGGEEEDEVDRGGGGASGNRWPRQETLALLKIRSDMDAVFLDATLKGPLWEDVSRKLAEMGYRRSAKKCKEKFENVHKYYKRTREGRTGRQDGKTYRFFSQLEALNNNIGPAATTLGAITASNIDLSPPSPHHQPIISAPTASTLDVYPVSVGVPVPMSSSVRVSSSHHQPQSPATTAVGVPSSSLFPPDFGAGMTPAAPGTVASVGISFSTDGFSSSSSTEDDDDDGETGGRPLDPVSGTIRKRSRHSSSTGETRRMMEIFEGLMKQVMQKQEAMQQRFLEVIEKREQDSMMRDEAYKRQEMARLSREHELMAQERAISASRDAAIVSFLQKITGQNIQLPSPVTAVPAPQLPLPQPPQPQAVKVAPLAHPQVPPVPQPRPPLATSPQAQRQQQDKTRQQHPQEQQMRSQQEVGSGGSLEPASSRWPKVEVLALIKLRSGLESRYQEAGPKGQLWEEISAGMQRMGYKRSAKRCKEKWENINKYFKKVKESNKKRPHDAKTCPYFHELDALYKRKLFGGTPSTGGAGRTTNPIGFANPQSSLADQQQPHQVSTKFDSPTTSKLQDGGDASRPQDNNNEGNGEPAKKPEDIVKEMIQEQEMPLPHNQQGQHLRMQDSEKMRNGDSGNMDPDEEDEYEEEGEDGNDDDEELLDRKMGYKIEFQKANTSNGRDRGEPSFLAIVQ